MTPEQTIETGPAEPTPTPTKWRARRRLASRLALIVLALGSGAAAALAHPPFGVLPGLLGYAVMMALAERMPSARRAALVGWLAGFAYFLISAWWVAEAFLVNPDAHAWMAPLAASLLPAVLALFWAGALALYHRFGRIGLLRPLTFAAWFVIFEWLRGTVLTGFPWNPLGASWPAGSAVSQFAAYGGVYGLSFVTLLSIAALVPLFDRRISAGRIKRRLGVALAGALLLVSVWLVGTARLDAGSVRLTETTVRIVQADVQQEAKWDEENYRAIVQRYVNLNARAGAVTPDIIVWPEGALPRVANDVFADGSGEAIARSLAEGQILLAGLSRADIEPGTGGEPQITYYNSLYALQGLGSDRGMQIAGVYDKHRLVPFGEFLPLGDLMTRTGLRSLTHMPADFTPGPRPQPLTLPGGVSIQPLICYEGLYPALPTGARADFIVNVSNDAWFGRSTGPRQHLNLAAYRSIEQGLAMVRATPTGVSAIIDPYGRIPSGQRMNPGESGVIDARVPQALEPTLFSRTGSWPLLILGFVLLPIFRRKRTFR